MVNLEILSSDFHSSSDSLPSQIPPVLFFEGYVPAGFPSPAEAYTENRLNLHDLVVQKPAATFFVRVNGDSMMGIGIYRGDLLIVDRSLEPVHRSIIVAVVNGEFTLKRLIKGDGRIKLRAENPLYPDLEITAETHFEIWGVVAYNLHDLRKP